MRVVAATFLASVVVQLAGCAARQPVIETRARIADAPEPALVAEVVDFSAVFDQKGESYSVRPAQVDPGLFRRVLLSPNLVFESSRSSLLDEPTVGPSAATPSSPGLPDALGRPIAIPLSSMLMNELQNRRATLVAPVIGRLWLGDVCNKGCSTGTWLERVLSRVHAAKADEETPTLALAVRELGLTWRVFEVVAEKAADGRLIFRLRRNESETSLCKDVKEVKLPVFHFQAELVGLRDGRIIARIDESRTPAFTLATDQRITAIEHTPNHATEYTEYLEGGQAVASSRYNYTKSWQDKVVRCENAVREYERILEVAGRLIDVPALAKETIGVSLAPFGK